MKNANEQKQRFKEEKEEQRNQEVDWLAYFQHIKPVCPWSLKAYMENKILHVTDPDGCELTWTACFRGSKHEALLFEYNEVTTVDQLYAVTEKIEQKYSELIAFWSHPDEKENNTPKPCVIVQDKQQLTDLRKKVGYKDD